MKNPNRIFTRFPGSRDGENVRTMVAPGHWHKQIGPKPDLLARFGTAILAGAWLAVLAPPLNIAWTAWFAYVPMLWALRSGDHKVNGWLAFVYGFTGNLCIFWWLIDTISIFSNIPWLLGLLILLFLSAGLGLPFVVLFQCVHYFRDRLGLYWILVFPALQVCLEYAQLYLFLFPYQHGVSQYQVPYVFQLVSVTGIWGVSYLVFGVNAVLAEMVFHWRESRSINWRLPMAAAVVVIAVSGYGYARFHRIENELQAQPPLRVLQLQQDLRAEQWKSMMRNRSARRKADRFWPEQSGRLSPGTVDLVVWPESSVMVASNSLLLERKFKRLTRKGQFALVFGAPSIIADSNPRRHYNSAFVLNANGKLAVRYDKMHLVPFSEYIPFAEYLPFVTDSIKMDSGHFTAGTTAAVAEVQGLRMGAPICYESIFQSTLRRYSDVDLLINITNDIWFADTAGPYLHAMLAAVRAVEFGQPVYRAAYSGLSFYVAPHGELLHETELFKRYTRVVNIRVRKIPTLYARFGDWFVFLCFFICAGATVWVRLKEGPEGSTGWHDK